jgi:hypothetical protein
VDPRRSNADSYATIALICGVAPIPLALLGLVPLAGCLSTPMTFVAIFGAIGFGIAGVLHARKSPERSAIPAASGLILGLCWLLALIVGAVWLFRSGTIQKLLELRAH